LNASQRKHIERYLFPLPQNVIVGSVAVAVKPQELQLIFDHNLNRLAKQYLQDFCQRWQTSSKIKPTTNSEIKKNKKVIVYVAINKQYSPLVTAEQHGVIKLKKLSSVPNSAQAYSINCLNTNNGITVYIMANQTAGLYNALLTFEQLLSAMSNADNIVIPSVQIIDWPDIEYRGVWGGMSKGWDRAENDSLWRYSKIKLNSLWNPFLWAQVDKNKKISFNFSQQLIQQGRRYNVHIVPILVHLDYMFGKYNLIGKNFPEIRGKAGKKPFKNTAPWCFANPKSQQVLDQIFEAIARDVASDYLWVWPSEHGDACHCAKCKGDKRQQNINEFKHLIHAYKKAKAIRPNLQMTLITTQGTHDDNLELLKYIPAEVGLDIYDGHLTYKTDINTPILKEYLPLIKAMRHAGRKVGVVPMFSASHAPSNMLFPFNTPRLAKTRMLEFKPLHIDRIIGWLPPNVFAQEINFQSMAEFAWNSTGRSSREFIASWAVRRGMREPELVTEVIKLLEPATLALSKVSNDKISRSISRMVAMLTGKKAKWGSFFEITKGFKDPSHAGLVKELQQCDQALNLAKQQGNDELIANAALLKQWIAIIERYTLFKADKKSGPEVRRDIAKLTAGLPTLWNSWIIYQHLNKQQEQYWRTELNSILKYFHNIRMN
jgi:hypothetical protein